MVVLFMLGQIDEAWPLDLKEVFVVHVVFTLCSLCVPTNLLDKNTGVFLPISDQFYCICWSVWIFLTFLNSEPSDETFTGSVSLVLSFMLTAAPLGHLELCWRRALSFMATSLETCKCPPWHTLIYCRHFLQVPLQTSVLNVCWYFLFFNPE